MKLKEKRLAFLNETIEHFNADNRGTINGECTYTGGCAIGRKIDATLAIGLDARNMGVGNPEVFVLLPQNLKDMGKDFLYEIQFLHDTASNWDKEGLSDKGKADVRRIKKRFEL